METVEQLLEAITAFGDPGFILAASGGLAAALLAAGDRRTAIALFVAIAASATIIASAKIGFMAFGAPHLYSPSGHAALATTFFFSLGATLGKTRGPARNKTRGPAWLGAAACAIFALLIAASRVLIGVHSPAEAAIGVAIGFCAFVVFHRLAAPRIFRRSGTTRRLFRDSDLPPRRGRREHQLRAAAGAYRRRARPAGALRTDD